MKTLPHEGALFTLAELAEAIGAEVETTKNWVRRGIISRARIGGRQLPNRLFSADDVYKAAVTYNLVKLGFGPSAAIEAVAAIWEQCNTKDLFFEHRQIYAILYPTHDEWTVLFCSQREHGGPFYKFTRSAGCSREKVRLPDRACAVFPITSTLTRLARRLESIIERIKEPPTENRRQAR